MLLGWNALCILALHYISPHTLYKQHSLNAINQGYILQALVLLTSLRTCKRGLALHMATRALVLT